ncbi:UNVERIFIED_CONTAM: proteasome (prosome, macropain) 26S subunit, non-ATPase, 9, putative [Hammondia hammondi]|eukprot:XP_008881941.1 proteasome (prosome, macropain) 26S subunit, non-ATPase, 9, putative [Hammondia hammondi]
MAELPEKLNVLVEKQKKMEEEMEALADYLTQPGMPGLTGGLLDDEGFPRADIDIYAIRGARNRLAILKTDYKEVRSQIEKELFALHAQGPVAVARRGCVRTGDALNAASVSTDSNTALKENPFIPFAKISELHENSPASKAGLRLDDLILQFGAVFIRRKSPPEPSEGDKQQVAADPAGDRPGCSSVEQVFERLPHEVGNHIGEEINITVFRNNATVNLKLIPQSWEGVGLVGCRFTPVTKRML